MEKITEEDVSGQSIDGQEQDLRMLEDLEETTVEEVNSLFLELEEEKVKNESLSTQCSELKKDIHLMKTREIEQGFYLLKNSFKANSSKFKLFQDLFFELADNMVDNSQG